MNKVSSTCCAVSLVTDRLSMGMLGAYGNTWVDTPCFDTLAFESCVFDQVILASPTVHGFYDSAWLGRQAGNSDSHTQPLPELLAAAGLETLLVTDDSDVVAHGAAETFGQIVVVDSAHESPLNGAIENTCLGRFFATASAQISEIEVPTVIWLHTRGMAAPWDAPLEMRRRYAAEEDPEPPTWRKVPRGQIDSQSDPDELLGVMQAYAGQVALWDTCLGVLSDAISDNPILHNALFSVMSSRGFPLGEHGRIGSGLQEEDEDELYSELLNVPWLCRIPGQATAVRSRSLLQPVDLYELLKRWSNGTSVGAPGREFGLTSEGHAREFTLTQAKSGAWALRTPAWLLRSDATGEVYKELYLKPDDRWEVNNVADSCHEVVEQLAHIYDEAIHGKQVSPLNEVLLYGVT